MSLMSKLRWLVIAPFFLGSVLTTTYQLGRRDVMDHAAIGLGEPFYRGVYHGQCRLIGDIQACPIDSRNPESPPFTWTAHHTPRSTPFPTPGAQR